MPNRATALFFAYYPGWILIVERSEARYRWRLDTRAPTGSMTFRCPATHDDVRWIEESGATCCEMGVLLPNSLEQIALTPAQRETAARLCSGVRRYTLIAEHASAEVAEEMRKLADGPARPQELGDTTCARDEIEQIVNERRAQGCTVALSARPEERVRIISLPMDRALAAR